MHKIAYICDTTWEYELGVENTTKVFSLKELQKKECIKSGECKPVKVLIRKIK